MTASEVHAICNQAVLPAWLLLILAPRWRWTRPLTVLLVLMLGVTYVALFASQFGRIEGGYGSLAAVTRLLANPYLLAAAWVHFLAFDLFVGSWMTSDAVRRDIPRRFVVPCLVLTFLAGPVGLLVYTAAVTGRSGSHLTRGFHD